jgi:hypothetical protein
MLYHACIQPQKEKEKSSHAIHSLSLKPGRLDALRFIIDLVT